MANPRIEPLTREQIGPDFDDIFDVIEKSNGYIPFSYLTLAHAPPILRAFSNLSKAVIRDEGTTDRGLRFLVAYVSSRTNGCMYCQAHNLRSAGTRGVPPEKLEAVWEYQTHPLFSDAERAALDLARNATLVPNEVDDELMTRLKQHYTSRQIVELLCVVCLFGWLNRFVDSLNVELDESTLGWADEFDLAGKSDWNPAHHLRNK
jgi:uncharacterized peroxidase-related enzyme